ncbi:PREDICTED: alpha-N-acetylgalactosaminide alpha-2,6-sialyltransferase 1 isoform X3 [Hipposideros armiger]|uniref:alpha-N-acetylgalactosaminide alpha-2,6-sialyltransferase n=1 Tax=Hipposideros armiger TaxID=186990 RepID=A0A8B7RKE9_HIPAR|nr:PREDICTED: alpha-N-acetylgalactosaminide alpha-2,6-sialyltransferase 1 isoform X3 [Hipposideros armiger]
MRFCLQRFSRRGQAARWLLLLAGLLFFLFALSSFIKEPTTKPARHQNIENSKERSSKSPQRATSPAPTMGRRTTIRVGSAQEISTLDTRPERTARTTAREPGTERTALLNSQDRKDVMMDTLPPRSQDRGMASNRTQSLSPKSQDTRTTEGRRDQSERPTAARTVSAKAWGRSVAPTARTPIPGVRAEVPTTAGAGSTGRRTKGVNSSVVPPTKRASATPRSAPSQSPTTQGGPRLQAINFKYEPKWDFEEKYSLDVGGLQTACPDSVKVKASKSLWLQNLFLPNLTLFLDSSHFNLSEWSRLEHFKPPFGFMDLNYSLVQKVVTRFPPVPQQQLLLASLPAGSPRLSGAVTKGYEQDVGIRTSFYGFTAFSLTQSLLALHNRGFQHVPVGKDIRYLHFLEGLRDYEWLEALLLNQTLAKQRLFWFRRRPQEAFRDALRLDRYLLLHPDLMRYIKNRFLRSKTLDTVHWRIYRPTTGALLLLTALQLCDQVRLCNLQQQECLDKEPWASAGLLSRGRWLGWVHTPEGGGVGVGECAHASGACTKPRRMEPHKGTGPQHAQS